ncbi:hypothetical protein CK203_044290 [Vitis vinifera]|uniref:Retrotransposon gag domain-containing protein n=1 Tax=Vitis vinifera TaxID=29760 RepID=A0A438GVB2_VITVI|nr:hypothetical protein CK203_044290 [Vitis vinifera]
MDTQQSRHVVLEDTPSDIVTPPVLPVQMPATQTSHDQVAVIPPIVTPVTIIEDPRSRMDRLEQRIRQMRDPDEMIPWDDPGDVPVATLPIGFRMPDIERYTGVRCPPADTEMVRFIRVISSENLGDLAQEFLRQYSFSGDTSVTRRELESLRQGSDEFARHLTGVPFQDFRSLVQALFDVDDGISRGLWSDIIPSLDTEGRAQQYPSVHPHTVTVRPSFHFQRPQTSIPRHEQSRPHRRRQRTYSDLEMPLDRAFERLRATGFLVPLAPRPPRVPYLRVFVLMSSAHITRWQATVLIIVLLYVIPYRILLIVVQLAFPYRPQTLILVRYDC